MLQRLNTQMQTAAIIPKSTNYEQLTDLLEFLNVCLLREVCRRSQGQRQLDYLHGLVLSEQEILAILSGKTDNTHIGDDEELGARLREIEERGFVRRSSHAMGTAHPLTQISALFQLRHIEEQCLVLCLAPEIDAKYSRVYAFLQDDITKKQPCVDLALKLFCEDMRDRLATRAIFSPRSPLVKNRLINLGEVQDGIVTLLQRPLSLDDRVTAFLVETPQLDGALSQWVEFVPPSDDSIRIDIQAEMKGLADRLLGNCFAGGEATLRPIIHLYGKFNSGKRLVAEYLGQRMCLPLLVADINRLPLSAGDRVEALWRLGRESLLRPSIVLVENFDVLLQEGRRGEVEALLDAVQEFSPLTIFSGTDAWKLRKPKSLFLSLVCEVPDASSRIVLWKEHLRDNPHGLSTNDLSELASKFSFTGDQIEDAIQFACDQAYWDSQPPRPLTAAALHQACRRISTPNLGGLARKVEPHYNWTDIVLPASQLTQLHELSSHVRHTQLVLESWGFARKLPYGRGVTALFNGLSGTGKTMAAGIIGGELGLDLYKIDLSCVVSKYIGETEKNLNRIFAEAEDSSAILFFDEADAVFGKRSEVKDAHDRYANIETAYLLQRIEDYNGVVILATNMKQNMDEAFVRRMRFIIHFPFPNDAERERIWEKAFPDAAPLDPKVDFRWLTRKLKITGGHIKNISVRAAFLASERQGVIDMDCLVEAARRELGKTGKVISLGDFGARENPEVAFVAVGAQ
jgi:winged helix domain-containing protein/ATPase family protein associated with various cellular activities (AAA)